MALEQFASPARSRTRLMPLTKSLSKQGWAPVTGAAKTEQNVGSAPSSATCAPEASSESCAPVSMVRWCHPSQRSLSCFAYARSRCVRWRCSALPTLVRRPSTDVRGGVGRRRLAPPRHWAAGGITPTSPALAGGGTGIVGENANVVLGGVQQAITLPGMAIMVPHALRPDAGDNDDGPNPAGWTV